MSADRCGPLAGFLTTTEAATALRIAGDTLKRWRTSGRGPKPCRVGGRVYYREADLTAWVESELKRSETAIP